MPVQQLVITLCALAGVVALALLIQRAFRPGSKLRPNLAGRLAIVEIRALDPRRRLVLARLDGREFLLLTGGANDVVVSGPGEPK
jgi:flagellar protein FliO/FliZ